LQVTGREYSDLIKKEVETLPGKRSCPVKYRGAPVSGVWMVVLFGRILDFIERESDI
jgi:hypothetical protein